MELIRWMQKQLREILNIYILCKTKLWLVNENIDNTKLDKKHSKNHKKFYKEPKLKKWYHRREEM